MILTLEGEYMALQAFIALPMQLRLFTNDFEPGAGTKIGDFTEAAFRGYEARELAKWEVERGPPCRAVHPQEVFELLGRRTDSVWVYGHYVTQGRKVIAVHREGPFELRNNGDNVAVDLILRLGK